MFGTLHELYLLPEQLVFRSCQAKRGVSLSPLVVEFAAASENEPAWGPALEAANWFLAQNKCRGRLQVIFSDHWVRYEILPLGAVVTSEADCLALAQSHYSRVYSAKPSLASGVDAWPLRLAKQGNQLFVAGVDPHLLENLKKLASQNALRLVGAEPLCPCLFDRYCREIGKSDGWLLLDEPGMLLAAWFEGGALASLRSQRYQDRSETDKVRQDIACRLLEQQAALLSLERGTVRLLSVMNSSLELPAPWRVDLLHQLFNFGSNAKTMSYASCRSTSISPPNNAA